MSVPHDVRKFSTCGPKHEWLARCRFLHHSQQTADMVRTRADPATKKSNDGGEAMRVNVMIRVRASFSDRCEPRQSEGTTTKGVSTLIEGKQLRSTQFHNFTG